MDKRRSDETPGGRRETSEEGERGQWLRLRICCIIRPAFRMFIVTSQIVVALFVIIMQVLFKVLHWFR